MILCCIEHKYPAVDLYNVLQSGFRIFIAPHIEQTPRETEEIVCVRLKINVAIEETLKKV